MVYLSHPRIEGQLDGDGEFDADVKNPFTTTSPVGSYPTLNENPFYLTGASASAAAGTSSAAARSNSVGAIPPQPAPPSFGTSPALKPKPAPPVLGSKPSHLKSTVSAPAPVQPNPAPAPPPAYAPTKQPPPPPPPTIPRASGGGSWAVALYDFEAQQPGDLAFRAGERVEVLEKTADQNGWWQGRVRGQQGIFPGNYVQMQ